MANTLPTWPKAELHLHLEGSISPQTLAELNPTISQRHLKEIYSCSGFSEFFRAFGLIGKHLRTPQDYAVATSRLLSSLMDQDVSYAEITISPGIALWNGLDFNQVFEAVREAQSGFPLRVQWIFESARQFGPEYASAIARLAAERVHRGVVAFGIGGDENRGPATWFANVFAFARTSGLRLTAHAGETSGPSSIWSALEIGAERIGHGVSALGDPELMRYLRDHDVPLEICITSNIVTGVVKHVKDHPIRRLYDAGVPIVLNTDDPGIFRCTLSSEYNIAAHEFGFSDYQMRHIASNAFRYAFR